MLLDPVCIIPRLIAKTLKEKLGKVVRRHDPRPLRIDATTANADGVHLVHQFTDEKKSEARRAKRLDAALRLDHDASVLHRVMEVVLLDHSEDNRAPSLVRNRSLGI